MSRIIEITVDEEEVLNSFDLNDVLNFFDYEEVLDAIPDDVIRDYLGNVIDEASFENYETEEGDEFLEEWKENLNAPF